LLWRREVIARRVHANGRVGGRDHEADMHTHVHLENNILFPRAVELEAKIL